MFCKHKELDNTIKHKTTLLPAAGWFMTMEALIILGLGSSGLVYATVAPTPGNDSCSQGIFGILTQ